jgi:hypothetical protein
MNQPTRSGAQQRRRPPAKRAGGQRQPDLWRTPPPLPAVELIAMPHEVGSVLRSLGDPPMHNGAAAGHYFNAVVQRSAAVAIALAVSVDLLAPDND